MFKPIVLIVLFCCLSRVLTAQQQPYLFTHLGVRDGLLSENIQSVQQDNKGYIWIASYDGLQRYDGQRFLSFRHRPGDSLSLPATGIATISIDKKNRLWILTTDNRVGYFNMADFSFHSVPVRFDTEVAKKAGTGLYLDRDGNAWFILIGYAALTYNEAKSEFSTEKNVFKLPVGWEPIHLWQDQNRNYWIGTPLGLVKYNPVKRMLSYRDHNLEKDPVIETFKEARTAIFAYLDKFNRFWITSWPEQGMYIKSYDIATGKITEWQADIGRLLSNKYYELHGITETADGSLWLSGHNLFARLSNNRLEILHSDLPGEYSIRYDGILQLFEDREKNVWVSTDKGLYRFNPSAQLFRPVPNRFYGKDSLHSPDVTDIYQLANGDILVSTWGSGIFTYDEHFTPIPGRYKLPGVGMVWCLHQTRNGDIWAGAQDGYLFRYDARSRSVKRERPEAFANSTIRQVTEDYNGDLWFGTQRGYLVKWTAAENKYEVKQHFQGTITRLFTDSMGHIWACTGNDGVYRINTEGSIMDHFTNNGEPGTGIRSLGASDIIQYDDSIFVIVSDGLNFLNIRNRGFKYFTVENGLPSSAISNIVKDKAGYVWMSTTMGILSYHPLKKKLSIYNAMDGVHTNAFNLASSTILKDGSIAIGTTHDNIVFDPRKLTVINYVPPQVLITGFSLFTKPLNLDSLVAREVIDLKFSQHSLVIQFSSLTYQNTYTIYYMMEGLDKDWMNDPANQATYNYLPPGNYTFKVGCRNEEGKFGRITELKIHVRSPFWKTWWFYSLLALIITGILYWFDKQRNQRIRREQQIRSSIAANLHEEVNTALQNINVLSEIAGMKAETQPEQSRDYIHEIKAKSRNMVIAMNDVLWSIDPANDSMTKTIDRIMEVTETMRNKYNSKISMQVDEPVKSLNLDMKSRHEFILIYKLAITTLAEILQAEQTSVQLDYAKGHLYLRIFSTAPHIRKSGNTVIKNINEMKARAAVINAALDIQSDEKGTGMIMDIRL